MPEDGCGLPSLLDDIAPKVFAIRLRSMLGTRALLVHLAGNRGTLP
jgi:hypothetical protein